VTEISVIDTSVIEIVFFAFDGIQGLDLTGPYDVFDGANRVLADTSPSRPRYRLTVASLGGGLVTTESGLQIATSPVDEVPPRFHTLALPGGNGTRLASNDPSTVAAVADLATRAERTITICSGAFVAAAAGLLDGHRVTTHWARAGSLDQRFPSVDVDPEPIYIHDGSIWSSAGVTAGIDLALAVVEHDHDADVAQIVARWLVMFLRRPGGQSQFATPVWTRRATVEPIRHAQDIVDAAPGDDHRVGLLAARVGMSERHFTRRFAEQVGISPAQYVTSIRVEAARRALETGNDTVEAVAQQCGFGTGETMRRTFARRLGASPDQYRQRFRQSHHQHAQNQGSTP
jgi:transcriptional regulator GlxA family with amidase domain